MKRVLLMVLSIVLVLASIFGMFACVAGVRDILNIKDYKLADSEFAKENLVAARDGIAQLKDNEQAYLDGYGTYTAGLASYAAGQQQLAEGKAQLDANTDAYNEGKETLSKIEPLLPYLNQYVQFRDGTLAKLPGFDNAQAWFVSIVRPIGARLGLEIPEDVTDFPAYINQMVADGKALLQQYEDGQVAYEEGKAQLAAGAAQLAAGKAQLSVFEEGELTLAAGGMALFEGMQPFFSYYSGEQAVKSLPEYCAEAFGLEIPGNLIVVENGAAKVDEEAYNEFCNYVLANMYKVDANGEVVVKNGYKMLDLDKCSTLCDMADQYLADQEADITAEVYGRIGLYAALAVACILSIIAGIMGIVASVSGSKKTGKTLGIIAAVLSVGALVAGFITNFTDYVYTVRLDQAGNYITETASKLDYVPVQQYSGSLQLTAIVVMAIVTVLFVIFACIASKAAKDKAAARAAAAAEDYDEAVYAAAAAAAAAAVAEEKVIAAETPAAAPVEEAPVVEEAPAAEAEAAPEDETVKE